MHSLIFTPIDLYPTTTTPNFVMRGIVKSEPVDVKLEPIETDVDLQGLTLVADDESMVKVKEGHPAVQPKTAAEWGDIPVINNGTNSKVRFIFLGT